MFASEEFIEFSRKLVCVRVETYENKATELIVRDLLGGRFANTAFVIYAPDGETKLSRSNRSPQRVLAGRGRRQSESDGEDQRVIQELEQILAEYEPKGDKAETTLQDFDEFRQSLNVASSDQRLLVVISGKESQIESVSENIKQVMVDEEIIGRFHLDQVDVAAEKEWAKSISDIGDTTGIFIIQAGEFGMDGKALSHLSLDATSEELKQAMLEANKTFADTEERKSYSDHVRKGRRQGIYFENEIPYGEDRDGDGQDDHGITLPPSQRGQADGGTGGDRRQRSGGGKGKRKKKK